MKITAIVFIITTTFLTIPALYTIWIPLSKHRPKKKKDYDPVLKQEDDNEEKYVDVSEGNERQDISVEDRKSKKMQGITGLNVAGLDIGDKFLTMALSTEEFPEETIPLGFFERISLLLDENKKSIAFGDEAFRRFTENKSKNERYEDEFKLSNENLDRGIYREAITQILKLLYQELDKKLSKEQQSRLHYVFVVPTYWRPKAKERLKTEILNEKNNKLQNIDEEHVRVIQREQTLSPFIHEVIARVLCLKFNVDNLILNLDIRNYSYAILHLGSTYCDLTFLKIEKDRDANNLDIERHEWKMLPEQHLLDLIVSSYGHSEVGVWKKESRRDYIKLLYQFEKLHKNRAKYTDKETAFILDLPKSLTSKKESVKVKEIDPKTKKLYITHKFLKTCFEEMKDKVKEWIISKRESFKDVRCVVMTGTYSNMEMVWNKAEQKWFKGMPVTIAVPENVHVFAMGGAYYIQKEMAMKATEQTQEAALG